MAVVKKSKMANLKNPGGGLKFYIFTDHSLYWIARIFRTRVRNTNQTNRLLYRVDLELKMFNHFALIEIV